MVDALMCTRDCKRSAEERQEEFLVETSHVFSFNSDFLRLTPLCTCGECNARRVGGVLLSKSCWSKCHLLV
jgi:hypothetical protein